MKRFLRHRNALSLPARVLALVLVVAAAAAPAGAQSTTSATLYRLEAGSSFSRGFFFSSRRRHTRLTCDWSSDVSLPI